jgi:hypothetical protein
MNRNLVGIIYGRFSIRSAHFIPIRWLTRQRRRFLRNQPIRKKNCLSWPCLVMDRDVMGKLYRGSSIDAFYQVSVHLVKRFQAILVSNWSISKKSSLKPLGQMNRNLVGIIYGRSSIRSAHFVPIRWQTRRQIFKKSTPIRNKNCLWWPCLVMDRDVMGNLYRGSSIDAFYQVY